MKFNSPRNKSIKFTIEINFHICDSFFQLKSFLWKTKLVAREYWRSVFAKGLPLCYDEWSLVSIVPASNGGTLLCWWLWYSTPFSTPRTALRERDKRRNDEDLRCNRFLLGFRGLSRIACSTPYPIVDALRFRRGGAVDDSTCGKTT